MNKPYQRDEVEQRQDYQGEKRELQRAEADEKREAAARRSKAGDEEE